MEIGSLDVLMEAAGYFRLSTIQCDRELAKLRQVVDSWREVARRLGISRAEQELMAPCFLGGEM